MELSARQLKPVILAVTPLVSAMVLSFLLPPETDIGIIQITFLLITAFGLEFGYLAGKSVGAGYVEENEELKEALQYGAKKWAEAVDTKKFIPSKVAARPTRSSGESPSREVKHNPQSRVSEKAQRASMQARKEAEAATEHIVTYPQPLIEENAGNVPQKQSKKVSK